MNYEQNKNSQLFFLFHKFSSLYSIYSSNHLSSCLNQDKYIIQIVTCGDFASSDTFDPLFPWADKILKHSPFKVPADKPNFTRRFNSYRKTHTQDNILRYIHIWSPRMTKKPKRITIKRNRKDKKQPMLKPQQLFSMRVTSWNKMLVCMLKMLRRKRKIWIFKWRDTLVRQICIKNLFSLCWLAQRAL